MLQENIVSNMNNYLQKATSKSQNMKIIFEIVNGSIETLNIEDDKLLKDVIEKTRNLLTMESMSSLFYENFNSSGKGKYNTK